MAKTSAIQKVLDLREDLIAEAKALSDDAERHAVMAVAGSINAIEDAQQTQRRLQR